MQERQSEIRPRFASTDTKDVATTCPLSFSAAMALPSEIWVLVFCHCDVQGLVSLGQVNRLLFEILRSPSMERVLETAVTGACPFMSHSELFDCDLGGSEPRLNGWLGSALVLNKRMQKHNVLLADFVEKTPASNEYSYLTGLHGLSTTQYSPGMQRLLSADESSFERQMALRKTKGALEDMLGVEGEEETKFFDNGVELAAHKGTKMVLARWKDGQLDLDNAHLLSIGEGGEAGSRTCLSQLTSHTLIIKSKDCYHSYYLLKEHHHLQLVHLFTLQALVPPPVFDYNGYLWTILNYQLVSIFTSFNDNSCNSYTTNMEPVHLPNKPLSRTFCTLAETPFRHRNGMKRFLLLSENPYSTCDLFVDLKTGQKYASRPLEAHDKVYPVMDRQRLCFVKRS
jgi:hypothetical protein